MVIVLALTSTWRSLTPFSKGILASIFFLHLSQCRLVAKVTVESLLSLPSAREEVAKKTEVRSAMRMRSSLFIVNVLGVSIYRSAIVVRGRSVGALVGRR